MATPSWNISGEYYETCSCDFICPCILTQMEGQPTKGWCVFAMGYKIGRGAFADVPLDGLGFIVIGRTPEAMGKGNWSVGVLIDDRATPAQRDAISAIVSGAAGGPMSALSGLVAQFVGAEPAAIRFDGNGSGWTVAAPPLVDMSARGAMGINPAATEPMHIGNTGHPANDRLTLCHPTKSHVSALGFTWNDVSGRNNGHYAPFNWRN